MAFCAAKLSYCVNGKYAEPTALITVTHLAILRHGNVRSTSPSCFGIDSERIMLAEGRQPLAVHRTLTHLHLRLTEAGLSCAMLANNASKQVMLKTINCSCTYLSNPPEPAHCAASNNCSYSTPCCTFAPKHCVVNTSFLHVASRLGNFHLLQVGKNQLCASDVDKSASATDCS